MSGAVRRRGFKVVLDYSFGAVAMAMPTVLSKLGAEVLAIDPYAATGAAARAGSRAAFWAAWAASWAVTTIDGPPRAMRSIAP